MAKATGTAAAHPVDVLGGKKLLPTQSRFLASPAPRKVYIGPLGSGKTEIICRQAILLSHYYLPNNGLIGRQTYPELRDTTRKRFMEVCPPELIRDASIPESGGGGYVEWKAGGRTIFRHLDTMSDMEFGSLDLGYFGIDEITETPERSFLMLEGRLGRHWQAAKVPHDQWPYSPGFGGGNPAGHDWVWRKFFSPTRAGRERAMYEGFQPEPRENEANLPPGYYDSLMAGKPEWWIRRYIRGELSALEGLVWPMFDDALHIVQDFRIPPGWNRYTAHDHGRRNPTACTWTACDEDGFLIVYRDYEVAGPTPPEHCAAFKRLEAGEKIRERRADPSMFSKTIPGSHGRWYSVADEYAESGFDLLPADNSGATLDRVSVLLAPDASRPFPSWHPRLGQRGAPRMFFFRSCERTIECVSSWRYKDHRDANLGLREEPVEYDDHLPDCLRYQVSAFPEAAPRTKALVYTPKQQQATKLKREWRATVKSIQHPKREPDYV